MTKKYLPSTQFGIPGTGTSLTENLNGLSWSSQMEWYRASQVDQATRLSYTQEEFLKFEMMEAAGEPQREEPYEEVARPFPGGVGGGIGGSLVQ